MKDLTEQQERERRALAGSILQVGATREVEAERRPTEGGNQGDDRER